MNDAARGFTLIETLIATAILIPAMVAIAFLFAYSAAANMTNQSRTASTLLVSEMLEQLRSGAVDSSALNAGQHSEYVSIGNDGTLITSGADAGAPYLRVWQIDAGSPRAVSVIVYALHPGLSRQPIEIARATMLRP